MIRNIRIAMIVAILLALALPFTVFAKGLSDGKVVFGGTYTLKSGQTLNGDLVLFGGVATLEAGSKVTGNVALLGGNLEANGDIQGDIIGFGGLINLAGSAVVHGDVLTVGAQLDRAPGATIQGEVNNAVNGPLTMTLPGGVTMPRFQVNFSPILDIIWFLFRVFIWSAVAVIAVMFLPRQSSRVGETAIRQPVVAAGLGILTFVIAPFILLVMIITIILIPVALLAVLVLAIAWGFGVIALGMEVGKRIALALNQDWAPAVSAGLGTFLLVLVMDGFSQVVPCIGWMLPALVAVLGTGAVALTRFGIQDYPLNPPLIPASGPQMDEPEPEREAPKSMEVAAVDEGSQVEAKPKRTRKKKEEPTEGEGDSPEDGVEI